MDNTAAEYLELMGFYREKGTRLRGWKSGTHKGRFLVLLDSGDLCFMQKGDALGDEDMVRDRRFGVDVGRAVSSWVFGGELMKDGLAAVA